MPKKFKIYAEDYDTLILTVAGASTSVSIESDDENDDDGDRVNTQEDQECCIRAMLDYRGVRAEPELIYDMIMAAKRALAKREDAGE